MMAIRPSKASIEPMMIINHPAKPTHPLQALRFIATSLSIRQVRRDRTSTRRSPPSSDRDDRRRAATVSGVEGGWQPYPGAHDGEAAFRLPPVEPGRVVGLGAICELRPARDDARIQDFKVSEFVTLDDGRRVLLHDGGRGYTIGIRSTGEQQPPDVRAGLTLGELTDDVLTVVLPDDEDDTEPHPWSWLSGLARARGLDVTADDLRALRYDVVFTDELRRWLAAHREESS
jgi:hypothetical protein